MDLPSYCAIPSYHSVSNHVTRPYTAFSATTACMASSELHHGYAGSLQRPAESSSSSCGLAIRLLLLPTPPSTLHCCSAFDDAVTFDYGVVTYPDVDFHHADIAPSWAHIASGNARGALARCCALHAGIPANRFDRMHITL